MPANSRWNLIRGFKGLNWASGISHIIRNLHFRHSNIYLSSNIQTSETFKILYSNKDSKPLVQDMEKKRLAQNNMSQPVRETYSQKSWFSGMRCQVCGSQCFGAICCLCKCLYSLYPPKTFLWNVGIYLQTTWHYFPENCDLDSLQ